MMAIPDLNNEQRKVLQKLKHESIADGFQRWMPVVDDDGKHWLFPVLETDEQPIEATISINAGDFLAAGMPGLNPTTERPDDRRIC